MFSHRTLPLSSFTGCSNFKIIREAEIAFAAKIPIDLNDRVAPAGTASHIEEASTQTGLAALIVPPALADLVPETIGLGISDEPQIAIASIQEKFAKMENFQWESFKSRIHPTAVIGAGAYIAPNDVQIGAHTVIGQNAVILERSIIGDNCKVGPLSAIGVEALEKWPGCDPNQLMPQTGGVWMENNTTVLSATTVVRASFGGFTRICEGAVLDNLIHLAHDCHVGERATVVACSEVSGRVVLGPDSYLGPNCAISNGLKVGAGATVTMGSTVVKDVAAETRVTGNFALPHKKWINFIKTFR